PRGRRAARPGGRVPRLRQDPRRVPAGPLQPRVRPRGAGARRRPGRRAGLPAGGAAEPAPGGPGRQAVSHGLAPAVALASLAALVVLESPARAGAPTDQLRSGTDRVLKILQDPDLKKPERTEERRTQIRAVANEIFDWQETGKRALGRGSQACSAPQR